MTDGLPSKLRPPAPAGPSVSRPALWARLGEGLRRPLTLLLAPAGYGKTSLAAQWTARLTGWRVAWLTLTPEDDDLGRFFVQLGAALHRLHPRLPAALAPLLRARPAPAPLALAEAVLAARRRGRRRVLVVLDDAHALTDPALHRALCHLLDHLPANTRLLATARQAPPWELAQRRARGALTELGPDDLRFTPAEAAAFLRQVMRVALPAAQTAALAERTEGWPAGLQLAALSLAGRADTASAVRAFAGSHHHVAAYLTQQVLAQQPADLRAFLLETSVLEALTARLCEAVTGRPDGQAWLEAAARAHLFLTPLDSRRRWFRYHSLFAEALREELERTQPGRAGELHRRASLWYADQAALAPAMRHALAIPDPALAGGLIETRANLMWVHNDIATLRSWIDALPREQIQARPRLALDYAWTLLNDGPETGLGAWLSLIEARLGAPDEEVSPVLLSAWRAEVEALRGELALRLEDFPGAEAHARSALAQMGPGPQRLRAVVGLMLGHALWAQGRLAEARPAYREAAAEGEVAGHHAAAVEAHGGAARVWLAEGQVREAAAACAQAQRVAGAAPTPVWTGIELIRRAEVHLETGDLAAAAPLLHEGLARAERGGDQAFIRAGCLGWARWCALQGDEAGVRRWLTRAAALAPYPAERAEVAAWQARLGVWGRPDASAEAGRALEIAEAGVGQWGQMFNALTRVYASLAAGRPAEALARAVAVREAVTAQGWHGVAVAAAAAGALAAHLAGQPEAAQRELGAALTVAAPEDLQAPFLCLGARLAPGLAAYEANPDNPAAARRHARRVLKALPAHTAEAPPALTAREHEVLKLIEAGLANAEIARQLVVSLNTVRAHTKALFRKLGVQRRTQAVARARALGWL